MRILGIDYGRKKIGLAISEGKIASPFKVLRVINFEDAVEKTKRILKQEKADVVVVGISEGEMAKESKRFAGKIGALVSDETLSTKDAQYLSITAGIGRKKRKNMEDAYAASVMLQRYIDSQKI